MKTDENEAYCEDCDAVKEELLLRNKSWVSNKAENSEKNNSTSTSPTTPAFNQGFFIPYSLCGTILSSVSPALLPISRRHHGKYLLPGRSH